MTNVWISTISVLALLALVVVVGASAGMGESDNAHRIQIGEIAPLFELSAVDGSTKALSSLRGKSPLVLIFFRGAW